jgi:hypothetical protein
MAEQATSTQEQSNYEVLKSKFEKGSISESEYQTQLEGLYANLTSAVLHDEKIVRTLEIIDTMRGDEKIYAIENVVKQVG